MEALRDALLRQAGLAGRYAVSGAAGLPAAFANPLAVALNYALEKGGSDYRFPDQYQALQSAMTRAGVPEPQGAIEKGVGFAAELGVPDPSDAPKVMAGLSHLIDPNMAQQFPDLISAMTVFHGSPHKWDKPDLSKVGTGEGAQAYGHGFYVAENPGVAKSYKSVLGSHKDRFYVDGDEVYPEMMDQYESLVVNAKAQPGVYNGDNKAKFLAAYEDQGVKPEQLEKLGQAWDRFDGRDVKMTSEELGHLYELDLPDETIAKMLDWDKPLSEQPEAVRKAIGELAAGDDPLLAELFEGGVSAEYLGAFDTSKGGQIYNTLAERFGGPAELSRRLSERGIPGIRYLDGTSRSAGDGTRNFVIFDEQYITPLKRNGEPIARGGEVGPLETITRELRPDDVATGKPVRFTFGRNTEKAPNMGARFGQDIEPAGRYMSPVGEKSRLDLPTMQYGEHEFRNPLVIDFGAGYEDAGNWKRVLSKQYGGLKGRALSDALRKDGYDGIITLSETAKGKDKYVSEIVALN